ncbi:unnamed protein product [Colias eurytheme]|nr:unnamed protein product [Colias eurytheme]
MLFVNKSSAYLFFKLNLIIILFNLASIESKGVKIELDSQDLLKIIRGLFEIKEFSQNYPAHRSDSSFRYRNPYHPEDGTVDELQKLQMQNVTYKQLLQKEDNLEQKIEEDNNKFLKNANKISDDELSDENSIENDYKKIHKLNPLLTKETKSTITNQKIPDLTKMNHDRKNFTPYKIRFDFKRRN